VSLKIVLGPELSITRTGTIIELNDKTRIKSIENLNEKSNIFSMILM